MLYSVRRLVFALGLVSFLLTGERSEAQSAQKKEEKSPAKVEEGKKTVNGVELYYKAIGSGDTIIVLHGGPGLDHTELLPQYKQLAKDFRLLFYDQRACGKSSGSFDEKSINVDTYVEDLDGIRQAFGIKKANLLGYSWGGLLGMFYTIKHPEAVDKLILVNSAPASLADIEDFGKVLDQRRSDAEKKELTRIRNSAEYLAGDPVKQHESRAFDLFGYRLQEFGLNRISIAMHNECRTGEGFQLCVNIETGLEQSLVEQVAYLDERFCRFGCKIQCDFLGSIRIEAVGPEAESKCGGNCLKCGHISHVEQPTRLFDEITQFMRR